MKGIYMAIKLGLDAKLFRGTAGTQGTIEVTNVKDVSLSLESGEADVTTRKAKGWKLSVATLKEASLEITILYDTEDGDFLAFKTAYFTNTPISLFVTDGDTTAHGLDADFSVTGFTVDQPLEEAVTVKVTAKPTASDRAPVWV